MRVEPPRSDWRFPGPARFDPDDDLVAAGADLAPGTLLEAYRRRGASEELLAKVVDLWNGFYEQGPPADQAEHGQRFGAFIGLAAQNGRPALGIDFAMAPFNLGDLQLGLAVEREQDYDCAPATDDLPDEDLVELGKIAVANLDERSDYYTRLSRAQAPGDPPPLYGQRTGVGTD